MHTTLDEMARDFQHSEEPEYYQDKENKFDKKFVRPKKQRISNFGSTEEPCLADITQKCLKSLTNKKTNGKMNRFSGVGVSLDEAMGSLVL